ncbi:uncharacterized protein LY89DRAFT_730774 [Mollisia scopiformis]|uniref:Uncharacterized protein n=1 Tax=Mollisia scopiformis TaxID=149040 RepID=A0A194XKM0_MOLSC|nr:uncharacterized protein LY89DRAFT_730774 [Mollisia scopiformis]KUJ20760.1 hypothetical protein LY89DRAFT_730774 [Mollisia scopiformis]
MESLTLLNRAILEARDKKSFWDKYKWLIIGGLIAVPIQLVMLYFYLRYRKRKKLAQRRDDEQYIQMPGR